MKIFLDDQAKDERSSWVPEGFVVATNPDEFKRIFEAALADSDTIEAISFDNDLGDEFDMEGVDLVKWINDNHPEIYEHKPSLTCHSMNQIAREEILNRIEDGRNNYERLIEMKGLKDSPHPFEKLC